MTNPASTDLDAQLSEDDIKNHLVYDILYDYELSNSAIDELYAFITKLIADRDAEHARHKEQMVELHQKLQAKAEREARLDEQLRTTASTIKRNETVFHKRNKVISGSERLAELRKEGDK